MPVPLRATVCVVGLASSVNVSVSAFDPTLVGVNVTLTEHEAAGMIVLLPQELAVRAN